MTMGHLECHLQYQRRNEANVEVKIAPPKIKLLRLWKRSIVLAVRRVQSRRVR